MFAFTSNFIALFAGAEGGEGGFTHFYNEWFNIPGFEAWKFLNLALFIGIMIYLVGKPLGEAFKAKREAIRADLIRAEQEKQAALTALTAADGKLAQLEAEKASILKRAEEEAAAEKARIEEHTRLETERLRSQAEAEVARVANQSRAELRRFSADESIRLAEQKLRASIDTVSDARLVKANIQEIGGLN